MPSSQVRLTDACALAGCEPTAAASAAVADLVSSGCSSPRSPAKAQQFQSSGCTTSWAAAAATRSSAGLMPSRVEELDPQREALRQAALAQVRQYPDPVLRMRAKEVEEFDDDLRRLADRMQRLMEDANGVGLAANQVGVVRRVFVFHPDPEGPCCFDHVICESTYGNRTRSRATIPERRTLLAQTR